MRCEISVASPCSLFEFCRGGKGFGMRYFLFDHLVASLALSRAVFSSSTVRTCMFQGCLAANNAHELAQHSKIYPRTRGSILACKRVLERAFRDVASGV